MNSPRRNRPLKNGYDILEIDLTVQTCPECNGSGLLYYDCDHDRVTREHYSDLPVELRYTNPCPLCDGTGKIDKEDHGYPEFE